MAATVAPRPLPARRRRGGLFGWLIQLFVFALVGGAAALLYFTWDLPSPDIATTTTRRPAVTLLAQDGKPLAHQGDLYGEAVRLKDLPAYVPAALMAVEDRRFRSHPGIDPFGLIRALYANLTAGEVVQGGSTLTQQLAKNLFLTPERNIRRKVQEALLALWLERRFSKDQLLEIYLNRVYLGAGAYGVDAAARLFFGVPARRVAVWQAALLAGLPKAPSRFNPRASPDLAVARAAEVLDAMVETGAITPAERDVELGRMRLPPPSVGQAGWFADWALADLPRLFPGNADLTLRATLEPRLQTVVEAKLEALLAGPGQRAGVTQGAVVILDAASGAVRAMAGGRDYRDSQFNRAVHARRQPGSAFKPLVFLAAIEKGATLDEMVADGPLTLGGWSPGNGHWKPRGEITLEDALAYSVNTAAVRVLQRAGGPRPVIALARRLGMTGDLPNNASIALGTGEVTLLELTAAYGAIANGGQRIIPYAIERADAGPRRLDVPRTLPLRAAAQDDVADLRQMLEAVVTRGTGRAAALPGRLVAGKTGTTQDFRDAWFIGFTGGSVIGIWLGNDDGRPMEEVSGGSLPARLFRAIAEAAPP
jgi:penicillin-binding protein 1A